MEQESILELLKVIFQFLGALGTGGIMSFIITRRLTKMERSKEEQREEKNKQEIERANTIATLCEACKILLRSNLYQDCEKIKKRGHMFLYEQEQLLESLKTYECLKGNGTAHARVTETLNKYDVVLDIDEFEHKD